MTQDQLNESDVVLDSIVSTPYKYGSPEYVNLELYLAWKGRGLPVETPAVRN